MQMHSDKQTPSVHNPDGVDTVSRDIRYAITENEAVNPHKYVRNDVMSFRKMKMCMVIKRNSVTGNESSKDAVDAKTSNEEGTTPASKHNIINADNNHKMWMVKTATLFLAPLSGLKVPELYDAWTVKSLM